MVLNRDEFFNRVQEIAGTDTSDRTMSFIEDMTDTYNELENRTPNGSVDWEQKYHELDDAWKKKYKARFFSGGSVAVPQRKEEEPERKENIQITDLFN